MEGVAGDFTGGTFFLCGDGGKGRPVLYASSEGQAGLIGKSLTDALEIIVGLPVWWDCLKFSGSGDLTVMQTTADHLCHDELTDQPVEARGRHTDGRWTEWQPADASGTAQLGASVTTVQARLTLVAGPGRRLRGRHRAQHHR